MELLGSSKKLYNQFLIVLRGQYVKRHTPSHGTLRASVLLALHKAERTELYDMDPCHRFTWSLAACVRDDSWDALRVGELSAFVTKQAPDSRVLADVAMVLADPYTAHALAYAAYKAVLDCVAHQTLPARHATLPTLMHLATLGDAALHMLTDTKATAPPPNLRLISGFAPLLAGLVVRDKLGDADVAAVVDQLVAFVRFFIVSLLTYPFF